MAGYPFRPTRSSRGVLNCRSCLDFDQPRVIPGRVKDANPESQRLLIEIPGNDGMRRHVSTNPVLEPLAAESLCP